MSTTNFPPGWDEARVRDVLAHYEGQTEDEQFAEIEAALEAEGVTMMAVPPNWCQKSEHCSRGLRAAKWHTP